MVVRPHTVVHPGAMAGVVSMCRADQGTRSLLVFFSDASTAALAMLASKRPPDHTMRAEVLLVELSCLDQLLDNRLLLTPTAQFRDITRVFQHGSKVEVCTQTVEGAKQNVEKRVRHISPCSLSVKPLQYSLGPRPHGRIRMIHCTPTQKRVPANIPARKGYMVD